MIVAYKAITNEDGSIELSDLYKDDGTTYKDPALHFKNVKHDGYWDASEWILQMFKDLKKNRKSDKVKELKSFCKDNDMDFEKTKQELIEMYKISKQLKFWKK